MVRETASVGTCRFLLRVCVCVRVRAFSSVASVSTDQRYLFLVFILFYFIPDKPVKIQKIWLCTHQQARGAICSSYLIMGPGLYLPNWRHATPLSWQSRGKTARPSFSTASGNEGNGRECRDIPWVVPDIPDTQPTPQCRASPQIATLLQNYWGLDVCVSPEAEAVVGERGYLNPSLSNWPLKAWAAHSHSAQCVSCQKPAMYTENERVTEYSANRISE